MWCAQCRTAARRLWSLPRHRPHKLRPIPISQFPIILLSLFCQCQKRPAGIRRALLVYRDIPICQSLSLWEQQRRPPPAAETGRRSSGRGQQDARPAPRAEADAGSRNPGSGTPQAWRRGYYDAAFAAASTTWLTSTEVVTVPTPPGTGVMASTTGSASPKRTSPQSLPSSLTWMPTSTTT